MKKQLIKQSPNFADTILSVINALVIVMNTKGQIIHFNQACEKMTGYTFAEVEGKYVWDLFLIPAEIKPVQEQWSHILSGEYPNYYRNYWCDRQGNLHLIDWSSTVLLDEQGEINYIIGTGIDITESHERAERERLVNDIAQQIRSSLNLSEILDNTVNELRKFLNCDRVVVFDFAEDYSGVIVAESVAEGYLSLLGQKIVDTCFQTGGIAFVSYTNGKKWAVNDVKKVGLPECYLELLTSFQVKSSLVVPILLKEEKNAKLYLWGLLIAHQCGQTREWHEQELECLDQLSVQLSIAIQQSLFYQQAQSEIQEKKEAELALSKTNELLETAVYKRTQRLSAINAQLQNEIRERRQAEMAVRLQNRKSELFYQITLKIRRSLKLPDILQTTVDEVRQMLAVDRVLIYQIFPNGTGRTIAESLATGCSSILNIPFPAEVFPQEYQEAYAKGKVRAIANMEYTYQDKTPCLVDFLASLGVKAKLVVPISINEKLWGLLVAHHCQSFRYWTNFEIELLQQLGNQVGIALAQSQMWLSLQEKEKRYRTIVETATEGIWMIDCDDYTTFVNQKIADMLQYNITEMNNTVFWHYIDHDSEDEKLANLEKYRRGTLDQQDFKFQRRDGSTLWTIISAAPLWDEYHNYLGSIAMITDITDRKLAEAKLQKSLEEKEVLLKEIHHRVKNNLYVIYNLLDLQSNCTEDENIKTLFLDSQNRIQTMALIHEQLYQSDNLSEINFAEYIYNLAHNLLSSFGPHSEVTLDIDVQSEVCFNLETAIPCSLLINELITNSLKYAFPSQTPGVITIKLHQASDEKYHLIIGDNGQGIPAHIDWRNTNSLGLRLVNILAEQLEAEIQLENTAGTYFHLQFDYLNYEQRF